MTNDRRTRLKEYIDLKGEATVAELLELCGGCSNMTLWRDLNRIEQEGAIRRTRGGAISMRLVQPDIEGLYSQRATENKEAKREIALCAAQFVQAGHSVYLDAGSTLMNVAKRLDDKHYTIITSGANIAIELSQKRSGAVILLGGQINGNTLSCSGPQAETAISALNIDIALMATSGYSVQSGFTSGSPGEHSLKRSVIQKAGQVVMLMDKSKVGRSMPYTFATMEDVDVLITDGPLDPKVKASAAKCDVRVIEVKLTGK